MRMLFRKFGLIAIIVCIYSVSLYAAVPVEYYVSPNRFQVLLGFPEENKSYYFYNNSERLCFTFKLSGSWLPGKGVGLLRLKNGQAQAGVLLIPEKDLVPFEGADLVTRATKLITKIYSDSLGKNPEQTKVAPYESNKWPGIKKWNATWIVEKNEKKYEVQAEKLFIQIHPECVAQVTVQGSADDEKLTEELIDTLGFNDDPQCYWPFIRERPSQRGLCSMQGVPS
jgi:hypothetical protein